MKKNNLVMTGRNIDRRNTGSKRKIAGLLVTAALVAALTGCGAADDGKGKDVQSSSGSTEDQGLTEGEDLDIGQNMYLMGKIGEVIGNEVTIQLGDMPDMEEAPPEESKAESDLAMGEIAASVLTVPAQAAGVGEMGVGMEIEYSGESVTVNVPAGLDIRDASGQQITVNSLAKGNVIQFVVDDMEKLNLKSILVLE